MPNYALPLVRVMFQGKCGEPFLKGWFNTLFVENGGFEPLPVVDAVDISNEPTTPDQQTNNTRCTLR